MKYILYISFITIALSSCSADFFRKKVEFDIEAQKPKLAVVALWDSADGFPELMVTKSRNIGDESPFSYELYETDTVYFNPLDSTSYYISEEYTRLDTIAGVSIQVFKNDVLIVTVSEPYKPGRYLLPVSIGPENATYRLVVTAPGLDEVSSTQTMHKPISITNAKYIKEGIIDIDGYRQDEVRVTFTDDASEDNNYYAKDLIISQLQIDGSYNTIGFSGSVNDPLAERTVQGNVLPDKTFAGKETNLRIGLNGSFGDGFKSGDKIRFTLYSYTNDMFNYLKSLEDNNNTEDNPFAEPAPVWNNIANGFGIFGLSSSVDYEFTIP